MPLSLSSEQVAQFQRDGFLPYPEIVLTDDELQSLRAALDRVLNGQSNAKPDAVRNMSGKSGEVVTQIVNIWEAEPAFCRHLYNDRILPLVSQLVGDDTLRVWHDQIQIKPPFNGGPTIWHQDFPYWPVIAPGDLVSAWVALEDADEENGCMSMVPGSHKWGAYNGGTVGSDPATHGPGHDPAWLPEGAEVAVVPCPVKAGGVVFHHCMTWHGAPPNHSPRSRPAIAVHYMPGWTRYEPNEKTHLVEEHIHVGKGEILTGEHFPTVLDQGQILSALC